MTTTRDDGIAAAEREPLSSSAFLPFNPSDMVGMRVRPSEFARMCSVSRQTVSQWIKRGIVTLLPDGRLDPVVAARQTMSRLDPARVRARVFRTAMMDRKQLETDHEKLRSDLVTERAGRADAIKAAIFRQSDEYSHRMALFMDALLENFAELALAREDGRAEEWLDEIAGSIFWGNDTSPDDPPGDPPGDSQPGPLE